MEKECTYCRKTLKIDNFYRKKKGYESHCKKCKSEISKNRHSHICSMCGKEFKSAKKRAKFCSNKCSTESQKNRKTVSCEMCGSLVTRRNSNFNGKHFVYCSYECQYKGFSVYFSGINSIHYNNNLTDEERETRREYKEYHEWRKIIYERDNFTCQCCGNNKSGTLVAHHILNYSEHKNLRTDIDNGITLCNTCHRGFHNTYGYKKNNLEQLKEFIENTQNDECFFNGK